MLHQKPSATGMRSAHLHGVRMRVCDTHSYKTASGDEISPFAVVRIPK